jgi:hypothetical protein
MRVHCQEIVELVTDYRQLSQAMLELRPTFGGHNLLFGRARPGSRFAEWRPVSGPLVVWTAEAVRINRRALIQAKGRQRQSPRLAYAAAAADVGKNAEQPGSKRGPAFKFVETSNHRQPRLLDDFLGRRVGRDIAACRLQHHGRPRPYDLSECFGIAGTQSADQGHIGLLAVIANTAPQAIASGVGT